MPDDRDCLTCPYPSYRDQNLIFCGTCIRKILEERKQEMEGQHEPDHTDNPSEQ
jgi:hypothetical protein